MHASTHCIGTIPSHNDLLNNIFNGVDRMSARLDRKYGCQPSGPVDFPEFKELKERIKTVFGNTKIVLALKQPPNLLRHFTKAEFLSNQFLHNSTLTNGLFRFECNDTRCM